jgi:cellulose synthase/poly-beta-1,6-N-acetylglucosamine synthase-like glycosyltransferase
MLFLYICIFFFVMYSFTILNYWLAWKEIPVFRPGKKQPAVKISVIIPARNEEQNIGNIIEDLLQQSYPSHFFEIIIVDDHSTDKTAEIVKKYTGIKLVQLSGLSINSYKKKAIETGIMVSANNWIVTTDADCRADKNWLYTIASCIEEKKPVLIAGPVSMNCSNSFLQIFQSLDFMVLQGITGAAIHKNIHSMGNGANLAYSKEVFNEVSGFAGIDHIASGDDMLLMYKIWVRHPERVCYLKSQDVIVTTDAEKTWKAFFNQRIRWASKAKKYQDRKMFPILLMVYLFNCSFIALFIAGFLEQRYWLYLAGMFVGKILIELPLFISVSKFFNKQWSVKLFPLFQPVHIIYTVLSGLLGQAGRYSWKGRKVK